MCRKGDTEECASKARMMKMFSTGFQATEYRNLVWPHRFQCMCMEACVGLSWDDVGGDGGFQVGQKPLRGHIYTNVPRCLGQRAPCPGKAASLHSPSGSHLGTLRSQVRFALPLLRRALPLMCPTQPSTQSSPPTSKPSQDATSLVPSTPL